MSANDLGARWRKLMGASPAAEAVGDELLRRWAESHRRYHTLEHLAACLNAVDALADEAADVIAVRLAVWFHDAVYNRRPGEDEQASAALAEDRLRRLKVATDRVAEVARLVRLTATHQPAPDDRNGAVLCDADLSVLGGTPESYARYAAQIREEYADIDEVDFRAGRRRVLEAFAAREPLFRTVPAQALWEERARRNVRTELALLSVAG
jgi:predicted metal-dependent HD superfamily phosphohydrolase